MHGEKRVHSKVAYQKIFIHWKGHGYYEHSNRHYNQLNRYFDKFGNGINRSKSSLSEKCPISSMTLGNFDTYDIVQVGQLHSDFNMNIKDISLKYHITCLNDEKYATHWFKETKYQRSTLSTLGGGIYVTTLGYERILPFNNRFSFKQCHELKRISLLLIY